ncbi:hypothetical protein EYF80_040360 [Liparis tanakae]|uniref:Uncharacterized protein n=1 Tax=Liparis tanakae TaxID=230148 RepID=A0A4Z2G8J8_9TELE|nr:hypothetical protein EYF80_040360 [Liparis tanakae]
MLTSSPAGSFPLTPVTPLRVWMVKASLRPPLSRGSFHARLSVVSLIWVTTLRGADGGPEGTNGNVRYPERQAHTEAPAAAAWLNPGQPVQRPSEAALN